MKFCLARERLNAQLPKPGGDWTQQAALNDALKKHNEKVAALVKETPFVEPIREVLLNDLKYR